MLHIFKKTFINAHVYHQSARVASPKTSLSRMKMAAFWCSSAPTLSNRQTAKSQGPCSETPTIKWQTYCFAMMQEEVHSDVWWVCEPTLHRCRNPCKPGRAALRLGGPGHMTPPSGRYTWAPQGAELWTWKGTVRARRKLWKSKQASSSVRVTWDVHLWCVCLRLTQLHGVVLQHQMLLEVRQ